jgi:osmoprotectant transport system permease protein
MGYGPSRLLFEVELPLALPALLAGVRIATVTAVSLTTVGAIVGYGGLGNLIYDGMESFFKAQVLTASAICVVLAIVADVLLLWLQRALTPWTRAVRRERPKRRGQAAGRGAEGTGGGADGSGTGSGPEDGPGDGADDSAAGDGGTGRGGPLGLAGKTTG